jgi:hypothetical protein
MISVSAESKEQQREMEAIKHGDKRRATRNTGDAVRVVRLGRVREWVLAD